MRTFWSPNDSCCRPLAGFHSAGKRHQIVDFSRLCPPNLQRQIRGWPLQIWWHYPSVFPLFCFFFFTLQITAAMQWEHLIDHDVFACCRIRERHSTLNPFISSDDDFCSLHSYRTWESTPRIPMCMRWHARLRFYFGSSFVSRRLERRGPRKAERRGGFDICTDCREPLSACCVNWDVHRARWRHRLV